MSTRDSLGAVRERAERALLNDDAGNISRVYWRGAGVELARDVLALLRLLSEKESE